MPIPTEPIGSIPGLKTQVLRAAAPAKFVIACPPLRSEKIKALERPRPARGGTELLPEYPISIHTVRLPVLSKNPSLRARTVREILRVVC
jgi:hypothetical protein